LRRNGVDRSETAGIVLFLHGPCEY
jgi:hypothetical protein